MFTECLFNNGCCLKHWRHKGKTWQKAFIESFLKMQDLAIKPRLALNSQSKSCLSLLSAKIASMHQGQLERFLKHRVSEMSQV